MFTYNTTIRLHNTDAAGVLFFGDIYDIVNAALEEYLESIEFSIAYIINESNFVLPVVHLEADYKSPLKVGNKISVIVELEKIGSSSLTLTFKFLNKEKKIMCTAKTVHVAVDKKSWQKIPLPEKLKEALNKDI